ncbi:MAG: M50 family metallopeptidase [Candidatus Babeliales bacterium]|jgi:regulator of sigma E protease
MSIHAIFGFFSIKMLPLLWAVLGIGILITIHECGHFVFCKLFGVHTPTFSIGFGPEIFRKKIGTTNFRLAAIPLGGYVEIAGHAEVGQGAQEFASAVGPESFESKPYWQKVLVMSGGIIFNLIFAIVVLASLFMVGSSGPQAVIVGNVVKDSAAELADIKTGDAIININDRALADDAGQVLRDAREVLLHEIRSTPNGSVRMLIRRGGDVIVRTFTLGSREEDGKAIGVLGAELATPLPRLPFFSAIAAGASETFKMAGMVLYGIKYLFAHRTLEGAGGPVMIMSMISGAAQHGLSALLLFLAFISINLAMLNILPLPVLDGGQIAFISVEAILRRQIPLSIKNGISMVSWLLLMGLFVFLTYRDIVTLFGSKLTALYHKVVGLWR